jgi:hypothetical protein
MAVNDPMSLIYAGKMPADMPAGEMMGDEPDAEPDGKLSKEELFRRLFGHYVGPKAKQ